MQIFRTVILLSAATTLLACGNGDSGTMMSAQDDDTETFRQALPAAGDIELDYRSSGGSANALAGQQSLIAGMTAEAVIGTNAFMIGHFAIMHAVSRLPPTEEGPNSRVWQGTNNGIDVRVEAHRTLAPGGTRYDYVVAGRDAGTTGDFLPVIDGHVVRLDEQYQPRDGFGIVRFHLDHLNTLEPERAIDGKIRVGFRKANRAHQVHVRAINIVTPEDPGFPAAAEYVYAVRPDGSGAMQWFSKSDVKKDSAPLENVAVHSVWRADHSGIGSAVVFGGSLEVDYWHLVECWAGNFTKGYDMLETPGLRNDSGDASTCFGSPQDLETPAVEETLPDEDPAIPAPMPDEQG